MLSWTEAITAPLWFDTVMFRRMSAIAQFRLSALPLPFVSAPRKPKAPPSFR